MEILKTKLNGSQLIPFEASTDKLGPDMGYPYRENNFTKIVKSYNFDIIHFARSGYFEWPFNQRICPIQIETNIFGGKSIRFCSPDLQGQTRPWVHQSLQL